MLFTLCVVVKKYVCSIFRWPFNFHIFFPLHLLEPSSFFFLLAIFIIQHYDMTSLNRMVVTNKHACDDTFQYGKKKQNKRSAKCMNEPIRA